MIQSLTQPVVILSLMGFALVALASSFVRAYVRRSR